MMLTSNSATEWWKMFQESIAKELSNTPSQRLWEAWGSRGRRTIFYTEDLLPPVARELGLEWETELLAVDYAMSLPISRVPLVFVEAENDIGNAYNEVRKLCCLSAPVRVLLTVGEWDATEGVWSHGGLRLTLLKTWQAIVEAHVKARPSASVLGVLVGEWCDALPARSDHRLRFYSYLIDANAALSTDQTEVLFERIIPSAGLI